ncbi:MAG: hypothetical protein Q8K60_04240 [Parachlamydiaceae bacterium]|nr:hypothetical protein [Parachlamydiaceae bacterium]
MDMQNHLMAITNWIINDLKSNSIRAVEAIWNENENTAVLSFYINGNIAEEELENISVASAEIIAHCSNGLLKENYIRWDYPKPLPEKVFAYQKEESFE